MKENSKRINNQFSSSMAFESKSDANDDETLKHINTYFINEYLQSGTSLQKKETEVPFSKETPVLAGFSIVTGPNRAKKAIELALSQPIFDDKIIKESSAILLLISSHKIDVDIDEIGEINDFIQTKAGYDASIIMSVNEDENLEDALAVTIVLY